MWFCRPSLAVAGCRRLSLSGPGVRRDNPSEPTDVHVLAIARLAEGRGRGHSPPRRREHASARECASEGEGLLGLRSMYRNGSRPLLTAISVDCSPARAYASGPTQFAPSIGSALHCRAGKNVQSILEYFVAYKETGASLLRSISLYSRKHFLRIYMVKPFPRIPRVPIL